MIRVGQVGGAYGVEGAVKVLPLTDFDDRFAAGSRLMLEGAEREVEWSRPGHPGLVVKFHGIDNRTVADLFRGRYLEVEDEAARPLSEGRFYHHQVGVSRDGVVEHLIPATKDAVVEVDVDAGRVVVADWLVSVEDAR